MIPVAVIARQARYFDRQHQAHAIHAHFGDQAFKSASFTPLAAGQTQIFINDSHLMKAKRFGLIRQFILAALALPMMFNLMGCRLTDIDIGDPSQMMGLNLFAHHVRYPHTNKERR